MSGSPPLYNLLLQQLIDLNTRTLPDRSQTNVEVLLLLDEFARLGHAAVIARGFSYVAGYGLRLLPVLQSPAQLRREYDPIWRRRSWRIAGSNSPSRQGAEDGPGPLRASGFWTYAGRSQSRPTLLSKDNRTTTESDQRRALLMPQELIQMSSRRLVILRAGIPPVRGDKIVYWRERVFTPRQSPPPFVPAFTGAGNVAAVTEATAVASSPSTLGVLDLRLELVGRVLTTPAWSLFRQKGGGRGGGGLGRAVHRRVGALGSDGAVRWR